MITFTNILASWIIYSNFDSEGCERTCDVCTKKVVTQHEEAIAASWPKANALSDYSSVQEENEVSLI